MDRFVSGFIRASLAWLGLGTLLGAAMVFWPPAIGYVRPAHLHALTLGFVSMMIFGVAYHVIPRFTGRPLYSPRTAMIHLWVANLGLAGMVVGWIGRSLAVGAATPLLHTGALLSTVGAWLFIVNLWRTLGPTAPRVVMLSRKPGRAEPAGAPARRTVEAVR